MTERQSELIRFLEQHGPATHDGRRTLRGGDGFTFRITKQWLTRYLLHGIIRRFNVPSPRRGVPRPYYDSTTPRY